MLDQQDKLFRAIPLTAVACFVLGCIVLSILRICIMKDFNTTRRNAKIDCISTIPLTIASVLAIVAAVMAGRRSNDFNKRLTLIAGLEIAGSVIIVLSSILLHHWILLQSCTTIQSSRAKEAPRDGQTWSRRPKSRGGLASLRRHRVCTGLAGRVGGNNGEPARELRRLAGVPRPGPTGSSAQPTISIPPPSLPRTIVSSEPTTVTAPRPIIRRKPVPPRDPTLHKTASQPITTAGPIPPSVPPVGDALRNTRQTPTRAESVAREPSPVQPTRLGGQYGAQTKPSSSTSSRPTVPTRSEAQVLPNQAQRIGPVSTLERGSGMGSVPQIIGVGGSIEQPQGPQGPRGYTQPSMVGRVTLAPLLCNSSADQEQDQERNIAGIMRQPRRPHTLPLDAQLESDGPSHDIPTYQQKTSNPYQESLAEQLQSDMGYPFDVGGQSFTSYLQQMRGAAPSQLYNPSSNIPLIVDRAPASSNIQQRFSGPYSNPLYSQPPPLDVGGRGSTSNLPTTQQARPSVYETSPASQGGVPSTVNMQDDLDQAYRPPDISPLNSPSTSPTGTRHGGLAGTRASSSAISVSSVSDEEAPPQQRQPNPSS